MNLTTTVAIRPLCHSVFILEPEVNNSSATVDTILSDNIQLCNEFGKSTASSDLKNVLLGIGYPNVQICPVNLSNFQSLISSIAANSSTKSFVLVNLCDGCETDGYPGLSVLRYIHQYRPRIAYTGATPLFYEITTSKPILKRYLQKAGVSTSPFVEITPLTTVSDINALGSFPLIVKPSISYASISITEKSIVHSAEEALKQSQNVSGAAEGVFVERFLNGREFTAFVSGNAKKGVKIYQVAERVFNASLSSHQRILAFDKYWEGYGIDGSVPEQPTSVYTYAPAPENLQEKLKGVARDSFLGVCGDGYGRVDMRTESMDSLEPIVLEVNANCGVSFNLDEFTSTVGEILRMSNETSQQFANDLIKFALDRHSSS